MSATRLPRCCSNALPASCFFSANARATAAAFALNRSIAAIAESGAVFSSQGRLQQPLRWLATSSSTKAVSAAAAGLESSPLLITKHAPDFTADAVLPSGEIGKVTLSDFRKEGKGVVLLFYPLDFTFVCPSELLAFNRATREFQQLNFQVLGVSVDSVYSHLAWTRVSPAEGGVGPLQFPLVSDIKRDISSSFHVLLQPAAVAIRALIIIDKAGSVRHCTLNDLPLGRSVDEALRVCEMINAVSEQQQHSTAAAAAKGLKAAAAAGVQLVCPANWRRGEKMMRASFEGVKEYLSEKEKSLKEKISEKL